MLWTKTMSIPPTAPPTEIPNWPLAAPSQRSTIPTESRMTNSSVRIHRNFREMIPPPVDPDPPFRDKSVVERHGLVDLALGLQ